jgi:hypothetical protein
MPSALAPKIRVMVEADWVDGPRLATWLRSHPDFHPGDLSLTSHRALLRWEAGVAANIFAVDRVLTEIEFPLAWLPAELGTKSPNRIARHRQRTAAEVG